MELSVLIVDDEPQVRKALEELLRQFCPYTAIKGAVSGTDEALALLSTQEIDVLFLDINLGSNVSGFDLLDQVRKPGFDVVFVTAHAEHALKAFAYGAVHYLLKPVDYQMLMDTMSRIRKRRENTAAPDWQQMARAFNQALPTAPAKIALSDNNITRFVALDDIAYLESNGSYTIFHLQDKQRYTKSRNLKHFEDVLQGYGNFVRVHKSFIVNKTHIKAYRKSNQYLELFSGATVPTAIGYRALVMQLGDHLII